jgi:hypothetical protein
MIRHCTVASLVVLASAAFARAEDVPEVDLLAYDLAPISVEPVIKLSLVEPAAAEPGIAPNVEGTTRTAASASSASSERPVGFTVAGSRWWTIGAGVANNFSSATDVNIHGSFSQFLADDFEFLIEAAAWYFNQPGTDTGGLSGSMVFRWHFWQSDNKRWTTFADAGIGLLGAFDNVPDGGSSFDFLPRAGAGFTYALDPATDTGDGLESRGSRLVVGVRWHHISNARINSDTRNPARDGIMVYAGLEFPF